MNRVQVYISILVLALLASVIGHWSIVAVSNETSPTIVEASPSIVADHCIAYTDDEFITLEYSFKIDPGNDKNPFAMVHASVMDDVNATIRDMGHAGGLLGGTHKSGKIQEKMNLLDDLSEPYLVAVVTVGNKGDANFARRAFVVPIHGGDKVAGADAASWRD